MSFFSLSLFMVCFTLAGASESFRSDLPPQLQFDQWLAGAKSIEIQNLQQKKVFEKAIHSGFEGWLAKNAIQVSSEQEAELKSMPDEAIDPLLRDSALAWSGINKMDLSFSPDKLPGSSLFKPFFVRNHAFELSQAGKTQRAQEYLKSEIAKSEYPDSLWLDLGRIEYAAGNYKAASQDFEKISADSLDYVRAHEEMAWSLLRDHDTQRLRGQLVTLASPAFRNRATPEINLLFAISNISLCNYDSVRQDFSNFISAAGERAKQIDHALSLKVLPIPTNLDFFSKLAELRVQMRERDLKYPGLTGNERVALEKKLSEAKMSRNEVFGRYWRNERAIAEANVKRMRFVKLAWMSIHRSLNAKKEQMHNDSISSVSAHPIRVEKNQQFFPYDGVVWSDEIFRLRSSFADRCHGGIAK